jgi:hypothetical protein
MGSTVSAFCQIRQKRANTKKLAQLQQSFGKSEERVTHDRLLKRIVEDIENCTKGSEDLNCQVDAWVKQVKNFETAVQRAQSKPQPRCAGESPTNGVNSKGG